LALARRWRAVTLNFRSCSGELNRLPQFYHSGHTDDLEDVVALLLQREPTTRLVAVGVSLGGNVLLKWLGERGADAPGQLVGAVAISVPFELAPCAEALDRGFRRRVYAANFLRSMRRKVRLKALRDGGFAARVDLPLALRARTFAEYDHAVTARLHGFADARDYWVRASSGRYLGRIRRPTLLVSALDDPIVPPAALPDPARLPDWVSAEFLPRGATAASQSERERRHVEALARLVEGKTRDAEAAMREHLGDHPRDLVVFQRLYFIWFWQGRFPEMLDLSTALARHHPGNSFMLGLHA